MLKHHDLVLLPIFDEPALDLIVDFLTHFKQSAVRHCFGSLHRNQTALTEPNLAEVFLFAIVIQEYLFAKHVSRDAVPDFIPVDFLQFHFSPKND